MSLEPDGRSGDRTSGSAQRFTSSVLGLARILGRMVLPVPEPPLSDGAVTLRSPGESDLPAIEQGIADAEVVRWFGSPEHSARQILELNRSPWTEGTGATFSICSPQDGCVGHVWVNLAGSRGGSVGFWLLPEARGRGLATRSVRLISRWALRELGLARLSLFTEPSNEKSQRVAERTGFVREGVLRSYGEVEGRRVDNWSTHCFPQTSARTTRDRTSLCRRVSSQDASRSANVTT